MGLDWRAYLHFFNDRPLLATLARLAYSSMLFQLLVMIVGLAALANRTGNRSLLSIFNSDFCKTLSAAVAAQLKGSGFDA